MLSHEIDALVADRFKASWERMVLMAAIAAPHDTELPYGDRFHARGQALVAMKAASASHITWPRTTTESKWKMVAHVMRGCFNDELCKLGKCVLCAPKEGTQ